MKEKIEWELVRTARPSTPKLCPSGPAARSFQPLGPVRSPARGWAWAPLSYRLPPLLGTGGTNLCQPARPRGTPRLRFLCGSKLSAPCRVSCSALRARLASRITSTPRSMSDQIPTCPSFRPRKNQNFENWAPRSSRAWRLRDRPSEVSFVPDVRLIAHVTRLVSLSYVQSTCQVQQQALLLSQRSISPVRQHVCLASVRHGTNTSQYYRRRASWRRRRPLGR